jgi:hypothetical protein
MVGGNVEQVYYVISLREPHGMCIYWAHGVVGELCSG